MPYPIATSAAPLTVLAGIENRVPVLMQDGGGQPLDLDGVTLAAAVERPGSTEDVASTTGGGIVVEVVDAEAGSALLRLDSDAADAVREAVVDWGAATLAVRVVVGPGVLYEVRLPLLSERSIPDAALAGYVVAPTLAVTFSGPAGVDVAAEWLAVRAFGATVEEVEGARDSAGRHAENTRRLALTDSDDVTLLDVATGADVPGQGPTVPHLVGRAEAAAEQAGEDREATRGDRQAVETAVSGFDQHVADARGTITADAEAAQDVIANDLAAGEGALIAYATDVVRPTVDAYTEGVAIPAVEAASEAGLVALAAAGAGRLSGAFDPWIVDPAAPDYTAAMHLDDKRGVFYDPTSSTWRYLSDGTAVTRPSVAYSWAAADVARYPRSVLSGFYRPSLLVERATTNLIPSSESFAGTGWSNQGGVITTAVLAETYLGLTVNRVTFTSGALRLASTGVSTSDSAVPSLSISVLTSWQRFDFSGTLSGVTYRASGYVRYTNANHPSLTLRLRSTGGFLTFQLNPVNIGGVYDFAGVQVEASTVSSTYVRTSGAAAGRAAEVATFPVATGSGGVTLYTSHAHRRGASGALSYGDAATSDVRVYQATAGRLRLSVRNAGVEVYGQDATTGLVEGNLVEVWAYVDPTAGTVAWSEYRNGVLRQSWNGAFAPFTVVRAATAVLSNPGAYRAFDLSAGNVPVAAARTTDGTLLSLRPTDGDTVAGKGGAFTRGSEARLDTYALA